MNVEERSLNPFHDCVKPVLTSVFGGWNSLLYDRNKGGYSGKVVEDASREEEEKTIPRHSLRENFSAAFSRANVASRKSFPSRAQPCLAAHSRQLPPANRISNIPLTLCAHPRINFATKEVCGIVEKPAPYSRFETRFDAMFPLPVKWNTILW